MYSVYSVYSWRQLFSKIKKKIFLFYKKNKKKIFSFPKELKRTIHYTHYTLQLRKSYKFEVKLVHTIHNYTQLYTQLRKLYKFEVR